MRAWLVSHIAQMGWRVAISPRLVLTRSAEAEYFLPGGGHGHDHLAGPGRGQPGASDQVVPGHGRQSTKMVG